MVFGNSGIVDGRDCGVLNKKIMLEPDSVDRNDLGDLVLDQEPSNPEEYNEHNSILKVYLIF